MVPTTGDLNSRTPGGIVAYSDYLADKGYATTSQVNPWKIAVRKVFETVEGEGWESLELTSVDLDEYLARFQTLAGAQYKAESITAYKRRIRNAIDAHEHYLTTGRPPAFRQGPKRATQAEDRASGGSVVKLDAKPSTTERPDTDSTSGDGLIPFPFVLGNGRMVTLQLPPRMSGDDVNRLSAFLRTLQDDERIDQRQIPEQTGEQSQAA